MTINNEWVDKHFDESYVSSVGALDEEFWSRYTAAHVDRLDHYLENEYAQFCSEVGIKPRDGLFIPLSGGLDSSTALTFAAKYADSKEWDRKKIVALFCDRENAYEAEHEDKSFARQLAKELGVTYEERDIEPLIKSLSEVEPEVTSPVLEDERICRARGLATYTLADKLNLVSIDTGNLSEELLAQWTTGCYVGQFNLFGELFKSEEYNFAEHLGVPDYIVKRPKVTSELRDGALIAGSREDYNKVDPILYSYLKGRSAEEIEAEIDTGDLDVSKIISRVEAHKHRAHAGVPNVEMSGAHLDNRGYYSSKKEYNPLVSVLDKHREVELL